MKINHMGLEAFFQAANDKSISVAAEKLGLTQSALSQRIMREQANSSNRSGAKIVGILQSTECDGAGAAIQLKRQSS
jgi:hypothetical protein